MRKQLLSKALFVALAMGATSPILAADINVSNATELAKAVSSAQAGDVIILAGGTYQTEAQIDLRKNLTLVGASKDVVIDGGGTHRLFLVADKANVTVKNLTIQNGHADGGSTSDSGAGIRVSGNCTLTVDNCRFLNNTVTSVESNWTGGGAIHTMDNAKLIVDHSEFIGNSAFQGGAIILWNTDAEISHTLFQGNKTVGPDEGKKDSSKGGAICVRTDNGNVHTHNFSYDVFLENSAWSRGGAVSYNVSGGAQGQNTVFRGCSLIRNTTNIDIDDPQKTAANDGGEGGGFWIDTDGKAKIYFYSCTIAQNYATQHGGGISFPSFKNKGADQEARFIHCTITDNHNLDNCGNGAGLWINDNSKGGAIIIANTILTGNVSMKVDDQGYDASKPAEHWEYSDLVVNKAPENVTLQDDVIGFIRNADTFTGTTENTTVQFTEMPWQDEISKEALLGDLAAYNEDYYVYPFSMSAMTWLDGDLGNQELDATYDCPTDALGNEWTVKCIGAVGGDEDYLTALDVPVFYNEEKATAIAAPRTVAKATKGIYTLSGMKVKKVTKKGVYIQDGRKVVLK